MLSVSQVIILQLKPSKAPKMKLYHNFSYRFSILLLFAHHE